VVSLTPRPLYLHGKSSQYALTRRLGLDALKGTKISYPCRESKHGHQARGLVNTPNMLSRLAKGFLVTLILRLSSYLGVILKKFLTVTISA
jgi:hypothetical protein